MQRIQAQQRHLLERTSRLYERALGVAGCKPPETTPECQNNIVIVATNQRPGDDVVTLKRCAKAAAFAFILLGAIIQISAEEKPVWTDPAFVKFMKRLGITLLVIAVLVAVVYSVWFFCGCL